MQCSAEMHDNIKGISLFKDTKTTCATLMIGFTGSLTIAASVYAFSISNSQEFTNAAGIMFGTFAGIVVLASAAIYLSYYNHPLKSQLTETQEKWKKCNSEYLEKGKDLPDPVKKILDEIKFAANPISGYELL